MPVKQTSQSLFMPIQEAGQVADIASQALPDRLHSRLWTIAPCITAIPQAHVTSGGQHARHERNIPSPSSPRPVISSRVTWLVTFVTQGPARRIPSRPLPYSNACAGSRLKVGMNAYGPPLTQSWICLRGKPTLGLSIVPVLDAVSRRDLLQHPREQPSDHGRLPSSIPDFAMPSPPRPYPNQPGHRTVTLLCDSSVPSGKFAPNYTIPGISRVISPSMRLDIQSHIAGRRAVPPVYISNNFIYLLTCSHLSVLKCLWTTTLTRPAAKH